MNSEEMDRHGIYPCAYRFDGNRDVRVEYRGTGLWAVVDGGSNLNRDGQWEYEPLPSSRDPAFFTRCRFTLDQALRLAIEYASVIAKT
jgi:hypothetical protein